MSIAEERGGRGDVIVVLTWWESEDVSIAEERGGRGDVIVVLTWWESEDVSIAAEGGGEGGCNGSFNLEQALQLRIARSEGSRIFVPILIVLVRNTVD